MHILIVEDHEESRAYLKHLLLSHDCDVVEAADGLEGVEKALAHCPDMIISDSLMPKMDGFQMLMEIKRSEMTRDIPFLFYSGNYIGDQDAELALSLGADAYLLKPMPPWQLWHEIQKRFRTTEKGAEERSEEKATDENLRLYGKVVAGKLDEKIRELQQEISQRRTAEERLHSLSRSLIEKLELERRHIARELHDEVGQALTAVKLNLQALMLSARIDQNDICYRESMTTLARALQLVRNLSFNLRPSLLDDLGFAAAINWYLERMAKISGILYSVDVPEMRLSAETEICCFRIAQEAITNALRHANPTTIRVVMTSLQDGVRLTIKNDGSAFDVQKTLERAAAGGSFGLLSMQERAALAGGTLTIISEQGQGTEVRFDQRTAQP